jgi:hypothetical protein
MTSSLKYCFNSSSVWCLYVYTLAFKYIPPPHKKKHSGQETWLASQMTHLGNMAVTQSIDSHAVYAEGPSKWNQSSTLEWCTCLNNYSRWANCDQWPSLIMHGIIYLVQNSLTWEYSSLSSNTKLTPKPPVHLLYWLTFDKYYNSIYSLSHQPILHLVPSHHAYAVLYRNEGDTVYPHTAYSTSYCKCKNHTIAQGKSTKTHNLLLTLQ